MRGLARVTEGMTTGLTGMAASGESNQQREVGGISGSVVGSNGPGARMAQLNPQVVFGLRGERGKVYPVKLSESEMRHCMPRRYMYASGMSSASALSS
jgi:hypothetical protein